MNKKAHFFFLLLLAVFYINSAHALNLLSVEFQSQSQKFRVEVTKFECPHDQKKVVFLPSGKIKSGSAIIECNQSITLGEITLKEKYTKSFCTLFISGNLIFRDSEEAFEIYLYSALELKKTEESDKCFVLNEQEKNDDKPFIPGNRAVLHTKDKVYTIPLVSIKNSNLILVLPDESDWKEI